MDLPNSPTEGDIESRTGLLEILERTISRIASTDHEQRVTNIDSIRSTCMDFKRSCVLLVNTNRKYDDLANARGRAGILHIQLSSILSTCLNDYSDKQRMGLILDRAKDTALATNVDAEIERQLASVDEAAPMDDDQHLTIAFYANVAFELLERLDDWLHFSELKKGPDVIERSIEFPPEYFNAGVMVLNEFASVIRERYGDKGAHVKIHQSDLRVTLLIETANSKEEIERTLDEYGKVLAGQRSVEDFAASALERVRLESALELAQARLNAEHRISTVLEAEVRARGEQLDHVTHLLAGALASHHHLATGHQEVALEAVRSISEERRLRVLLEVTRITAGLVEAEDRQELLDTAKVAPGEDVGAVESRLRKRLNRLIVDHPSLIRRLTTAVVSGVLSHEAAIWLEALLRGFK